MILNPMKQLSDHRAVGPVRAAHRRDVGCRSVWRRIAPQAHVGGSSRRTGDRTAFDWCYLAIGASVIGCPSRAPWNKWGDPLAGGNRLCRERPLIGLQPRRERFRDGVGGNPLSPQPHADTKANPLVEDFLEAVADRSPAAVSVALIGTRKCRRVARLPAPQGAAAGASGCVSRTVAAALRGHRDRTCGRIGKAFWLSNTMPEILKLIKLNLFFRSWPCGARLSELARFCGLFRKSLLLRAIVGTCGGASAIRTICG